jgi:tRNA 5-methylaminomethyl-2-thiouridine biosynthesis bifunctional protein
MQAITPARIEFIGATPVSRTYGDSYFMPGQGLAESEVVFIQASQLAERFASLAAGQFFVIGETGFGTGLNCLLAARCFQRHAPAGARLQLVSSELHPLTRKDLDQALEPWTELAPWAERLIAAYPPAAPGYHRLQLAGNVELTLMLGDALELWQGWQGQVDAWFLDGFAPASNPAMWQPSLLTALAERARPGASVATFTAAGHVRRSLADAGFEVQREPGFAGKRHRTVAYWPGSWQARRIHNGRALVAGAGLAGASTARALAERGWQVTVLAPQGPADAASGNLAGVLYATPSAHLTPQNRFYQSALIHAQGWLQRYGFPASDDQGRLNDVILRPPDQKAADKLAQAHDSGAWPAEMLARRDENEYLLQGAGYLSPPGWCRHLLNHPGIETRPVALGSFLSDDRLQAQLSNGNEIEPDLLVLCTAEASLNFPGLGWLPLKLIRGQVSYCRSTEASRRWDRAICHAGYFTPAIAGLHCVGATFDLKDPNPAIKEGDNQTNLDQLRQHLPMAWSALGGDQIERVDCRAALRCQSTDFLPLAGPLPDPTSIPHRLIPGAYLNIAHGSRGLTHTPLCASLVADLASGLSLPVDPALAGALAPERFILRHRRRDPDWRPDTH